MIAVIFFIIDIFKKGSRGFPLLASYLKNVAGKPITLVIGLSDDLIYFEKNAKILKKEFKKMQINFLNNFSKHNSIKGRKNIMNIKNEAIRELENYRNNVNHNLSHRNINLIEYDEKILKRQFYDTTVNNRANDVITVVSKINTQNISEKIGEDLTFFLKEEEWKKYFEKNLEFLQEKLGKNANCAYSIIHFDEGVPHLHSMFVFNKKQEKKEIYTEKDIDEEKIKKNLKMDFSRYCKENEITKDNFDKERFESFEDFKKDYYSQKRQEKIEFQLKKLNKSIDKNNYIYPSSSAIRVDYRKFNNEFVEVMKENKEFKQFKENIEKVMKQDIEVVTKMTEKLVKSKDLENIKAEMKDIKKDLVKNFLNDMNNKDKKNQLEDFFYKEKLTNQKLKMTDVDFQLKMKNVQEILLKNNDFSIEKFFANKKMQTKEIFKKIVNFAKSFSSDEDIKRLEKYFEKYEKKYNNIDKENLFRTKEKLDYEISFKKNEIDIISKMSNSIERERYRTQKKVDENNKIIENQAIKIEKNNIEINNQIKKFNEMKDIQKQLPQLHEKAKQKAITELTAEYKRQQNYISIAESKAITELKESKEIKENAEIKAIRQIVSDVENNKQKFVREYKQIAREEIETEIADKKQELKVLENNINNQRIIEQSNRNSYENYKRNIERIKKENEEIEKQIAEKRSLSIEELAEKTLKNAPISDFEIDDYIEKNQNKFQNLLEERQEKIENEIAEEMKEDTKQAFAVFKEFMRQYAKKFVYKDLISFREAKELTIQAFAEVKTTSENFFADFIGNLKSKVQELIVERQEKQSVKNKIQTR